MFGESLWCVWVRQLNAWINTLAYCLLQNIHFYHVNTSSHNFLVTCLISVYAKVPAGTIIYRRRLSSLVYAENWHNQQFCCWGEKVMFVVHGKTSLCSLLSACFLKSQFYVVFVGVYFHVSKNTLICGKLPYVQNYFHMFKNAIIWTKIILYVQRAVFFFIRESSASHSNRQSTVHGVDPMYFI